LDSSTKFPNLAPATAFLLFKLSGQPLPGVHVHVETMHGDLINGLTNAFFLPLYIHKAATEPLDASIAREGPFLVCLTFAVTVLASFHAWWYYDTRSSWIAFFATIGSIFGVCLYQWPHGDESLIVVQLIWQLLVCSANVGYPFSTKIVMGLMSACTTLWLSYLTDRENSLVVLALLGRFCVGLKMRL
jgi:hypothetical protein